MSKTIELIDKYRIEQVCDGDYNPPSYIWEDNTGEVIRCKDCKYYVIEAELCDRRLYNCRNMYYTEPDDYCSRGER